MCGRFTLRTRPQAVAQAFDLLEPPAEFAARYNIAPSQPVAAVRFDATRGGRVLFWPRWGLVPSWADNPAIGNRMINARAEGIATKPAFRRAFKLRRCLIVADGFFEWHKEGASKQPFLIHRADNAPFAFAGLWECWGPDRLESCTIITTAANESLRSLHDRMPAILAPHDYARWLDPSAQDVTALAELLRPAANDLLAAVPVSTTVNNPRNDVPECVQPLGEPPH